MTPEKILDTKFAFRSFICHTCFLPVSIIMFEILKFYLVIYFVIFSAEMSGNAQITLGYGGMVVLAYLGTDGFRNKAPFIFAIPVAFLGIMTLTTRMAPKHKLFTALSFFVMGKSRNIWEK